MPTLRIVSVNDVYSLENLPRLKSLIAAHRGGADALVSVLAGDFVAPSLLSSLDHGRGMVDCLNDVGLDLVTFGNHEDDVPAEELRARTRELRARWLSTNVRGFAQDLPTSHVVEVGGVRVGFLGVVIHERALYRRAPFGGAEVTHANEAALSEAARLLTEERCACVVPITHQFIEDDRVLARSMAHRPFPVILGGHEHEVFLEQVEGTWIVKAGAEATRAVIIDLSWDEGSAPGAPRVAVRTEEVAGHPDDPELRARVTSHMKAVRELERATLVKLAPGESLSSVGTRARQTTLGTLLCSRIRDAEGAEACLVNGGGIRAAREYTERLTYGDVKAEMPFDNEIVVVRMPGAVLRDVVAASRARAPAEWGAFLQVDDGTAVGTGGAVTTVAGAPLSPERLYRVAIVRNLLDGMDGIEPLVRFAKDHPRDVPPPDSGRDIKLVVVDAFSVALFRQLGGFDAVDANRDGVLTAPEVAAAVARVTAEAPSEVTAELVIRALDADRDDVLTRDETDAADE